MKVMFRTDASVWIGTGHVMRCLTLANALRASGASCAFVTRAHEGNLIEAIRAQGHHAHVLPQAGMRHSAQADVGTDASYGAWLGADWETDARDTAKAAVDAGVHTLVADHYAIDARWERRLRPACQRLMAIDDLAERAHDCDLLVDQNAGRATADYEALVPPGCSIFAGPQYALLRPEFAELRATALATRRHRGSVRNLLIAMGGVDRHDMTGRILQALRSCDLHPASRIDVLLGSQAPLIGQVRAAAAGMPWPTEVHVDTKDVARILAASDVAIGAVGGSALERCCLGLPTLALVLAPNQRPGAEALERAGAVRILEGDQDLAPQLAAALKGLRKPGGLEHMIAASAAVTDGRGASRIAEALAHAHP